MGDHGKVILGKGQMCLRRHVEDPDSDVQFYTALLRSQAPALFFFIPNSHIMDFYPFLSRV